MCEGCSDALFSRPEPSCPLCRAGLDGAVSVCDVLTRKVHLEIDAEAAAKSRALCPEEYDQREAADAVAIEAGVERRLQEEREGTELMLFCMGGNFAMFPAQTFRMFGSNGPSVYSFLFTGFGAAALLGPILSARLTAKGGFELVSSVLAVLSAVALTLCRAFL